MTTLNANSPQVLQVYTLLQLAAEAFLGTSQPEDPAKPVGKYTPELSPEMLTFGNRHASKMTTAQAAEFFANWKVVAHQPNTATGFSATLFEYIGDPAKQPTSSKYVVSFRSTEFIEDYARDNVATNSLEVKELGWAIGQIADMKTWWDAVKSTVGSSQVDLTGYSLGGHLATAFYELNKPSVSNVYTFNGAGEGDDIVDAGDGDDDLMGMAGNDILSGGAGADILWGDGTLKPSQIGYSTTYGNDTLMGGGGNDGMAGQGGHDVLFGDDDDGTTQDLLVATLVHDWLDAGSVGSLVKSQDIAANDVGYRHAA